MTKLQVTLACRTDENFPTHCKGRDELEMAPTQGILKVVLVTVLQIFRVHLNPETSKTAFHRAKTECAKPLQKEAELYDKVLTTKNVGAQR